MAYPNAWFYRIGANGLDRVSLEDIERYAVARRFLNDPHRQLESLLSSGLDEDRNGELF
jgi:predicted ATPase